MEPLLPGRLREAEELKNPLFRVALPFIAGYFVSYVFRMANAVLGPTLAEEFGLSAGGLGLLTSVYFLSFALFQVPLGLLLDRFGPRRVDAALLLVAAAGAAWFASAQSAGSAIAARALIGLGVSGALMSTFTAYVLWYPPQRVAMMNAITFAAGAAGAVVATVPLELVLRVLPWRTVIMALAACTVLISLVIWFLAPERVPARAGGATLRESFRGLAGLFRDRAFLCIALGLGASQFAAVALQTLWIGPWLRDVGGCTPAEVALGLLWVNVAMALGYLVFARATEALGRRGAGPLPLLAAGVAVASATLGLFIVAGAEIAASGLAVPLWCLFVAAGTAVVLGFAISSRRYPKEMAGRVNTGVNLCGFAGMFGGQWAVGLVLDLWPQTARGYAAEGYPWALGLLWVVQFAGLLWLWSGRRLLEKEK